MCFEIVVLFHEFFINFKVFIWQHACAKQILLYFLSEANLETKI